MGEAIAICLSVVAILLSGWTLWRSEFRRGEIILSRPTIFFFGWDASGGEDRPKIMFRSALFSNAALGAVLENLYVIVVHDVTRWSLPFWGYDAGSGMVRGSGVYVGRDGHVAYHHFNPISSEDDFTFGEGNYSIEVWGRRFNDPADTLLGKYALRVEPGNLALDLAEHQAGVLWTWDPLSQSYWAERSPRPESISS